MKTVLVKRKGNLVAIPKSIHARNIRRRKAAAFENRRRRILQEILEYHQNDYDRAQVWIETFCLPRVPTLTVKEMLSRGNLKEIKRYLGEEKRRILKLLGDR